MRSRALWLGAAMLAVSTAIVTLTFVSHPDDLHHESWRSDIPWRFLFLPSAWIACIVLVVLDYRRKIVRPAQLGLLLATLAGPATFVGPALRDRPWLSAAEKLRHKWPDVRASGAQMLGEKAAPDGLPLLVDALADPDNGVRSAAATALARYGPRAESAIPALVAALDDKDWFVACQAGEALGAMRGFQEKVLPPLVAQLVEAEQSGRWCAASAIGKLGPGAAPALPALRAQMANEDASVRSAVRKALGNIGAPAVVAAPELARALHDPSQAVREEAQKALARIHAAK